MKKVLILIITMLSINMLMGSSSLIGTKQSMYEKSIRALLEKEYGQEDYDFYPLYGFDDQIVGYLAEYSDTFAYGLIKDTEKSNCSGSDDKCFLKRGKTWARYTYYMTTFPDKYVKKSEEIIPGTTLYHTESHFEAAGITDEKRYLIKCYHRDPSLKMTSYVPAVKRDGKFYN